MLNINVIISVENVKNKEQFYKLLMEFYSPFDVILTIWGKIPTASYKNLIPYKSDNCVVKKMLFKEISLALNNKSVIDICENIVQNEILEKITFGIHKDETPLFLLRDWEDMNFDSSSIIDHDKLLKFIENLVNENIIESFEIIND